MQAGLGFAEVENDGVETEHQPSKNDNLF